MPVRGPSEEEVVAAKMAALFGDRVQVGGPSGIVGGGDVVDAGQPASDLTRSGPIELTLGTPVILGFLDPDVVRGVMHEHLGQLRSCAEIERARSPAITGKVVMKWVINGDGRVVQVTRVESQMKNATVEDCVAARIKTWVFPKLPGGGIVVVTQPFVFKPTG